MKTVWNALRQVAVQGGAAAMGTGMVLLLTGSCAGAGPAAAGASEPQASGAVCESRWRDPGRGRDVPVRIRMPAGSGPVPVILFSHGLGGSLDAGTEWAQAWVQAGFAVVHLQHPGSDASLMEGVPLRQRMEALRSGMDGRQLIARTQDVSFVLDEMATREAEGICDLSRIDRSRVGMAGHSFGAHTTQAVAGQAFGRGFAGRDDLREPRIDAAVAFSPAPPRGDAGAARAAFAKIEIPFFSITGTADVVPELTDVSAADRTLPFLSMPPGSKYLLVFEGADHMAFGGNTTAPGRGRPPDPDLLEAIKRSTTAFWQAVLLGDDEARKWLEGEGLASLLGSGDRFEKK